MNGSIGENQKIIAKYLETKENSIPNPYMLVSSIEFSQNAQPVTGFVGIPRDRISKDHLRTMNEDTIYFGEFAQIHKNLGYLALDNNLIDDIANIVKTDSKFESFCESKKQEEIISFVNFVYSQMVDEVRGNYVSLRQDAETSNDAFETSIEPLAELVTAVIEKDITQHPFYVAFERYTTQGKIGRMLPEVHFTPRRSIN